MVEHHSLELRKDLQAKNMSLPLGEVEAAFKMVDEVDGNTFVRLFLRSPSVPAEVIVQAASIRWTLFSASRIPLSLCWLKGSRFDQIVHENSTECCGIFASGLPRSCSLVFNILILLMQILPCYASRSWTNASERVDFHAPVRATTPTFWLTALKSRQSKTKGRSDT